jgi:RhtB (resistance to homoserine/threonine) family protein
MDDYWAEFLKVAAAHLLAVASPGPDFAVVMRQSLGYGRRVGLWTSVGVGCGILLHIAYSLCGIALLIRSSDFWFTLLKYVAAAYIAWIGLQSLLTTPKLPNEERIEIARAPTAAAAFRTGFLTNALNPKATLFFLAVFATVISPSTPTLVKLGYGGWMTVATMGWFCLVASVFTAAEVRLKFLRHGHWLDRALGLILLGFAVSLAFAR